MFNGVTYDWPADSLGKEFEPALFVLFVLVIHRGCMVTRQFLGQLGDRLGNCSLGSAANQGFAVVATFGDDPIVIGNPPVDFAIDSLFRFGSANL